MFSNLLCLLIVFQATVGIAAEVYEWRNVKVVATRQVAGDNLHRSLPQNSTVAK